MILVTVGTHHQPFDRLIGALDTLPADELTVQYGHSRPPTDADVAVPFLPFHELRKRIADADVVVTHAGVGSILTARRAGHVPVVVPRRRSEGEHVDDHQLELTRALAEAGAVVPIWETTALADAVATVPSRTGARRNDAARLANAVSAALAPAGSRRSRPAGRSSRRG